MVISKKNSAPNASYELDIKIKQIQRLNYLGSVIIDDCKCDIKTEGTLE